MLGGNVRWLARYRHPRCAGRAEVAPQAAGGVRGSGAAAGRGRRGRGSAGNVAGAVSHDVAPGAGGRCDTGTAGPGDAGPDCSHGKVITGERGSRPRRPGWLAIGDRVRLAGTLHTVIAVAGTAVRLAASSGVVTEMSLAQLLMSEGFEVASAPSRPPLPPSTPLDGLPEAVAAEALWWERHIVEVLRGVPPQAPPGTRPKTGVRPGVGVADPPGAGQGGRADRGRQAGDGERDRQTASPLRGSRRGRDGRPPDRQARHSARAGGSGGGGGDAPGDRRGGAGVLADGDLPVLADRADPGRRPRPGRGGAAVAAQSLPAAGEAVGGQAHHRVGPDPPVAGRPAGRAVR